MTTTTAPARLRSRWAEPRVDHTIVALCLMGSLAGVAIPTRPVVYVVEPLLLAVAFLAVRYRAPAFRGRSATTVLAAGAMLIVVQVATDIYRGTDAADFLRGWARLVFFLVSFAAFSVLFTSRRRALVSVVAFNAGFLLAGIAFPTAQQAADPWKFAIANPLALVVLATLALRPLGRGASVVTLASLSAGNLLLGFRSLGLVAAATAVALTLPALRLRASGGRVQLLGVAVLVVLGMAGFAFTYERAASSGILGEASRTKYLNQSAGGSVLFGGRPELRASLYAIETSPVIGWGSWARDTHGFNKRARDALLDDGYILLGGAAPEERIPIHSHVFGAWVEAGIVGALFWLIVLSVALRCVVRALRTYTPATPWVTFAGLALLWDVLFSPFGAERRIVAALVLAGLLAVSPSRAVAET